MKELYISPEANIIAFAPIERLASLWDDVTANYGLRGNITFGGVSQTDSDIDVGETTPTEDIFG